MAFLNARNNSFRLRFAPNFFFQSVVDNWVRQLRQKPIPYETVQDYVLWSLQAVKFPQFAYDTVTQVRTAGFVQHYRSSRMPMNYFDRDLTLTFKFTEGYMNYWMMMDQLSEHLAFSNAKPYLPDITVDFLDYNGYIQTSAIFSHLVMYNVSSVDLNKSSNSADFNTFDVSFKWNILKLNLYTGEENAV